MKALSAFVVFVIVFNPTEIKAGSAAFHDQIGPSPAFLAGSASSSQFNPANPAGVFATVDDFMVPLGNPGDLMHVTGFQAVVTGLQNFVSWNLVDSWNVRIFSSLNAAGANHLGDVYNATFDAPTLLSNGYSALGELAYFDVDVLLAPGTYWVALTMGNDSALNGTVGIRHSLIGDFPCYFAVPSQGATFPLSAPAAYRLFGEPVPAPGAIAVLAMALLAGNRRRRGE